LGLAKSKKKEKVVYRQLTAEDRQRLSEGKPLLPHGTGGNIADHVAGKSTNHISVSLTAEGTKRYDSGNGMAIISVKKATEGNTNHIDHNNVLQSVKKKGTLTDLSNARDTKEELFKGYEGIPCDAIIDIID